MDFVIEQNQCRFVFFIVCVMNVLTRTVLRWVCAGLRSGFGANGSDRCVRGGSERTGSLRDLVFLSLRKSDSFTFLTLSSQCGSGRTVIGSTVFSNLNPSDCVAIP